MTVDPYLDPSTGVLINKLGIIDAERLQQVAADISAARLNELAARPLPGTYDLAHLRGFHRIIFGDVFAWAGQIRTVQISKQTGFCLPQHIESYAAGEFVKLARDGYLRNLASEEFIQKLAYTMLRSTRCTRSERATVAPNAPSSDSSPLKPDISSIGPQSTLRTISKRRWRHTRAICSR